ncbi:MAG: peptidylprolyl isomerase [Leeuwenhoekiella sp.]
MKTLRSLLLLVLVGASPVIAAQEDDSQTLLTIGAKPITAKDFKQVYLKNLDLVEDENQKGIDYYLDLFTNFKLKLREAYEQQIDQRTAFTRELNGYKDQLAENYMADAPVEEALIEEAYAHTKDEVRASHIMISLQGKSAPQDTLKAYRQIEEIRKKLINGADFVTLAKAESEDPSVANNNGDLGWFDAFSMVYPFEKAAYDTPVGEYSNIIKSRFGYHVLTTTDRRKSNGEVEVAHIMIVKNQNDTIDDNQRIDEIHQLYKQGKSFEELAEQYSDDSASARNGGKLKPFKAGKLNFPAFEEVAFALPQPGSVSDPVETEKGWHLIKLIAKRPVGTLDDLRPALLRQIKNDSRGELLEKAVIEKLQNLYNVSRNDKVVSAFVNYAGDSIASGSYNGNPNKTWPTKPVLTIADKEYTYADFEGYVKQNQRGNPFGAPQPEKLLGQLYDDFIIASLKNYHKDNLVNINEEYAAIVKEYEEGILLFTLMEEEIWDKAKNDTTGLQQFYDTHAKDYIVPQQYEVILANAEKKRNIKKARKMLQIGMGPDEIKTELNKPDDIAVFFTRKTSDLKEELPKGYVPELGVSEVLKDDDYTVVQVLKIIPEQKRTLSEARGRVTSDYQEYLEKQWLKTLKQKYPVKVHDKVFAEIKNELSR